MASMLFPVSVITLQHSARRSTSHQTLTLALALSSASAPVPSTISPGLLSQLPIADFCSIMPVVTVLCTPVIYQCWPALHHLACPVIALSRLVSSSPFFLSPPLHRTTTAPWLHHGREVFASTPIAPTLRMRSQEQEALYCTRLILVIESHKFVYGNKIN